MTKYIYTITHAIRYALLIIALFASVALVSLCSASVRSIIAVDPIYLGRLFASIVVACMLYAVDCWVEHFLHDTL